MIQVGDKFVYHWIGHEELYKGRIYQVEGVYRNCTCGKPEWLTGKREVPRRPHIHVRAKLIKAPIKYMEGDTDFTSVHSTRKPCATSTPPKARG
ncbi:hypothetical protein [Prevotella falsenii]|uniref:hypothetical protein n=1 Tax=Prevotella falsenii TaxID=515414 RepID=UPI001E39CDA3|nr:hypothetical protein [Prevotella falsenii]